MITTYSPALIFLLWPLTVKRCAGLPSIAPCNPRQCGPLSMMAVDAYVSPASRVPHEGLSPDRGAAALQAYEGRIRDGPVWFRRLCLSPGREDGRGSGSGPQPQAPRPEELNRSSLAVVRLPVPRRLQQLCLSGGRQTDLGGGKESWGTITRAPLESQPPVSRAGGGRIKSGRHTW